MMKPWEKRRAAEELETASARIAGVMGKPCLCTMEMYNGGEQCVLCETDLAVKTKDEGVIRSAARKCVRVLENLRLTSPDTAGSKQPTFIRNLYAILR